MAKATGGGFWSMDGKESPEAAEFWMKHGESLAVLRDALDKAFAEKDIATILYMDTSLRSLVNSILEAMAQRGVKFEVGEDKNN